MKQFCLLLSILITGAVSAQKPDSLDVRVFLATHITSTLAKDQQLTVHFVSVDTGMQWVTYKTQARKISGNVYRLKLERFRHYLLIFEMGDYSRRVDCIDNRKGKAAADQSFYVLLGDRKFNERDLTGLQACEFNDEDDEEEE
jgi:hypothetical protein